ncbi:hypothetical protein Syun_027608 [Stephania yunnanensis]|uniref:DDB1- and CUL4-associated factor 13 n=1 Tax=Stephania yunnanensis TaxID=152371 RepID=A0AAP0HQ38_9MAGN
MKVKVISRSTDEFTRERSQDLQRVFRNFDPNLRTHEKATEYVRALNAAKLEKIFARPFIGAMEGHIDAVSCMAKNPNHLKGIFSGSMDGDIRLWDLATRHCVHQFPGHQGAVKGLTASTDGRILVSCGTDCSVRLWNVPAASLMGLDSSSNYSSEPMAIYVSKNAFWGVDHQWDGDHFATAGAQVDLWDYNRSEPIRSFEWGKDTVISVRFNPGEPNLLATTSRDRGIILYDLRLSSPVRKLIMQTKTNSVAWNPMEPMNFTAANEDCNCYSFDARKLDEAKCVHKDHVSAVMDIDYSPTGREFVTGSYDRTLLPRERRKHEYLEAVKKRYKHLPDVKRIVRHRHLPKPIFKAAALRRIVIDAERKKEERRRAHSTPGSRPIVPIRKKRIIKELK